MISAHRLVQWTGQRVVLPFYHAIADDHLPHIAPLYPVLSVEQFEADLNFLLRHFEPVELPTLIEMTAKGQRPNRPVFHLSFDDGLRQCFEVVAPILHERGIPATFFLNTAFVGNRELFYRYKVALILDRWNHATEAERRNWQDGEAWAGSKEPEQRLNRLIWQQKEQADEWGAAMGLDFAAFLDSQRPYLTEAEVRELLLQGFTVGSHSVDHPEFGTIDEGAQQWQVTESFAYLGQAFGIDYRAFAFPFTDHGVSASFINWLHDPHGGNVALSLGTAGLKRDVIPTHLQRIPMEGYDVGGSSIINGELSYYLIKKWLGKNKIIR